VPADDEDAESMVDRVAVQAGQLGNFTASRYRQNRRSNCRNLAAEIRERRKYRFCTGTIGLISLEPNYNLLYKF
jgi:hypothetical protein